MATAAQTHKRWSITAEQVNRANQLAGIMASEVNIKEIIVPLGETETGAVVEAIYRHDTIHDRPEAPLDVYENHIPLGKPEFAAWCFLESLKNADN